MALALFITLKAGLLVALFSGLLLYSLTQLLTPTIEKKFSGQRARMIAVVLLSGSIVTSTTLFIWLLFNYLAGDNGNLQALLQKMADIIAASRNQIPVWINVYLPDGVDALRELISNWLRTHAQEAQSVGKETFHIMTHLLLGMIIGSMVALQGTIERPSHRPLAKALHARIANLQLIFQKIVFAQTRISFINAIFTAIYLVVVLPMAGINLPLTKSMIAITFFAGLIPVIGNIVSNTVIVIIGLSHSLDTALASLAFMVIIHKLEYFLNARIIGAQINAKSWELLSAILIMEAIFGLPGVVAAPIFYAYIKKELADQHLI